ncbi:MAG TPA: hypothetical protein VK589_04420, partial [Chryseolinea sp.]|nr:hypothetical protein [Chryseolinea sp.]
ILNEKRQIDGTSVNVLVEKPIRDKDIPSKMKATVIGFRLSYFEISHPESGRPKRELMGINKSIVPSSASL